MNKPISREGIARTMREAAWIAEHGTREEQAGKFIKPQTTPPTWVSNPPRRSRAGAPILADLRMLKPETDEQALKLARLRAAVQEGQEALDRGESEEVADLDRWFDKLEAAFGPVVAPDA